MLGNLPEFRRDPLGFFTSCARYGDVVLYRILRIPVYLVNRPEDIESVLSTNSRNFIKGRLVRGAVPLFGKGLFVSEGARWARLRKLTQPGFRRDRIPAYARAVQECARRMVGGWRGGDTLDIHGAMNNLTVEIVARALFGQDVEEDAAEISACLHVVLEHIRAQLDTGRLIPLGVPTPGNLRMKRALARLDAVVARIIERRRAPSGPSDDLLSRLLHPADPGTQLTAEDLRDEVVGLIVAGQETMAVTMTWTWYLLAHHPECEARLAAEIDAVIGSREVALEDLPRLTHALHVLLESLRLYPPAWTIPRSAAVDCVVGGFRVARGSSVNVSPWVVHRDPRYFVEPDVFNPDRWAGDLRERLPRYAYFPFGGGPRGCIGEPVAMVEALLILVTVAQRFRLRLTDREPVLPWPTLTLQPRGPVRMRLEPRSKEGTG